MTYGNRGFYLFWEIYELRDSDINHCFWKDPFFENPAFKLERNSVLELVEEIFHFIKSKFILIKIKIIILFLTYLQTRHHSRCSVYGMISDLISVSIFPDPSSPDPSWQKAEQKMVKIKSFVIFGLYLRSDKGKGYQRCFISYFELMVSFLWLLRTRTNHIFRQVCPRFTRKCQFWNWLNSDNKNCIVRKMIK